VPAAGPLGPNVSTMRFGDLMKELSSDWASLGQAPLTRDASGWPTADAVILVEDLRVNQRWNGPDPNAVPPDINGTYHLSFHGRATVFRPASSRSSPSSIRSTTRRRTSPPPI
jgi:hypothetical protein